MCWTDVRSGPFACRETCRRTCPASSTTGVHRQGERRLRYADLRSALDDREVATRTTSFAPVIVALDGVRPQRLPQAALDAWRDRGQGRLEPDRERQDRHRHRGDGRTGDANAGRRPDHRPAGAVAARTQREFDGRWALRRRRTDARGHHGVDVRLGVPAGRRLGAASDSWSSTRSTISAARVSGHRSTARCAAAARTDSDVRAAGRSPRSHADLVGPLVQRVSVDELAGEHLATRYPAAEVSLTPDERDRYEEHQGTFTDYLKQSDIRSGPAAMIRNSQAVRQRPGGPRGAAGEQRAREVMMNAQRKVDRLATVLAGTARTASSSSPPRPTSSTASRGASSSRR